MHSLHKYIHTFQNLETTYFLKIMRIFAPLSKIDILFINLDHLCLLSLKISKIHTQINLYFQIYYLSELY